MPLVRSAGGGGGGLAAPSAPALRAPVPRRPTPIRLNAQGLPVGGGGLALLQQAKRQGAHTGGILDFAAGPANRLIGALSQPVYSIGSLLNLDPVNALRHIGQIPIGLAGLVAPGSERLLNRIPGLKPTSSVLPSQSRLLEPLIGELPTGLKQAVGFGTDVALDPLSYLTFGAGGAARGAAGVGARLAKADMRATDEMVTRAVAGRGAGTHAFEDTVRAVTRQMDAEDALRATRGRGAHVGLNLPWKPGQGREIGTLPGSRLTSRGVSAGLDRLPGGARDQIADLGSYFKAGKTVAKEPEYRAATALRRSANLESQIMRREIHRELGQPLQKTLAAINKAGARAPDGAKWNFDNAGELIIHNIEQGAERFPIPKELEALRDWMKPRLDEMRRIEVEYGLPVAEVAGYVPRRLKNARDLKRMETWREIHNIPKHTTADPYFVHPREFDTLEAMKNYKATQIDVDNGLAKNVGDQVFEPETNLVKLMASRSDAHTKAIRTAAVTRVMAERHGLRRPGPVDVDVAGARQVAERATAERRGLEAFRPIEGERAGVAAARAGRLVRRQELAAAGRTRALGPQLRAAGELGAVGEAAEKGVQTAMRGRLVRGVPLEAQPVARTAGAQRRMRQYFGEGPIPAGERLGHARAAAAEREVLRVERGSVERARRKLVSATRSKDVARIRTARSELARAQRSHISSRLRYATLKERERQAERALRAARQQKDVGAIKAAQREERAATRALSRAEVGLARARGRTVGTRRQIRTAVRQEMKAGARLRLRLKNQEKVDEIRARLAGQPGREATPEEWKTALEEWQTAGIVGMEDVRLPPQMTKILTQMQHEVSRSFDQTEGHKPILHFLRKITSHWKSLALISPGYHLRNAYGDSIGAWWAGARNPVSYIQAGRILKAADNPEKLAKMRITIGERTLTGDEFLAEARAMGIWGQGGAALEPGFNLARDARFESEQQGLMRRLGVLRKVPGLRAAPGKGGVARLSQRVGQAREDATRLGTYLDLRKQGRGIIDAAEQTHKYLFDYGHVSDFVDEARRFWAPFITYTSKAVPRTLHRAATRPGYFPHHLELAGQLSDLAGVEPGGPSGLPIGQQGSFGIPDPGGVLHKILGMPADQPILWNPERTTPWGTLNTLDLANPQQTILSNFPNPMLKTPVETLTDHRFYYAGNAPRRAVANPLIQALERAGVPIPDFGPKTVAALGRDVPGYSAALDAWLQMLPVYGQQARLSNIDDPQRARAAAASFLAGLPVTSYNRAALAARAQKYGG